MTDKNWFVHTPMTVEQVVDLYRRGQRDFQRIDVPEESSFHGVDLSGANFRNSFLSCIDFREARLQNVCFDDTNVKVSDFRGSDLTGASFRGTAICSAKFRGAKMNGVIVENADWYGFKVNSVEKMIEAPD